MAALKVWFSTSFIERDYVWVMARGPSITDARYDEMMALIAGVGYDLSKMRKVPQQDMSVRQ